MSKEVRIEVKNYKLLKEGEYNLNDGTIFLMSGPNNKGKTSFLKLLQSIMEVKDATVNPVTHGEKEGYATGVITGADGLQYQFRYDFSVEGKPKFQFVAPDGKVIKAVGEMRAIFNYTHFTLEEFFDWSTSEAGRKKQRDIIMKLLEEKEIKEINDIDAKINTRTGELYIDRQNKKKALETLESVVNNSILSEEQKNLLKQEKAINDSYDVLVKRRDEIQELVKVDPEVTQKIATAKANKESAESNIKVAETEIERLKKLIVDQENIIKIQQSVAINNGNILLELTPKGDNSVDVDALNIELNGDGTETNPGILARIAKGETVKNALTVAKTLNQGTDDNKAKVETSKKEIEKLDENIETLRKRKKEIVMVSKNIPSNISIEEDYITIDNIPFTESDLSKSQATKAIAQLMMRVNKSPIMIMGDAEALGYKVLNELKVEAEANGKIMVFAEHVRYKEELELVCYDQLDQDNAIAQSEEGVPEQKDKPTLF